MTPLRKVALAGATGMLGQPILHHLLAQGFVVTVLTRDTSQSSKTLLQQHNSVNLHVGQVDYASLESLTTAIKGHDAVVSALARAAQRDEEYLIDACIAAGVPRFIPSAFGGDMAIPWVRNQPFWGDKLQQEAHLRRAVELSNNDFSYTMFTNGPVFDFVMQMKLFIDMAQRKIVLYDKGEKLLSTTTKDAIGRAVAEALKRPSETKNKNLYIESTVVSQRQLLKLAQELTVGQEWAIAEMETYPLWKESEEKWNSGVRGFAVGPGFLVRGLFSEGFGGCFERTDNNLLNVEKMSESEVKDFLKRYM